jgi:hypothetical protein
LEGGTRLFIIDGGKVLLMGMVRPACCNVKRSRYATVALRWTAGLLEAAKGFRRLKAYRPLRALRAADCSPSQVRDRKQA